jgi:hypothetical protein
MLAIGPRRLALNRQTQIWILAVIGFFLITFHLCFFAYFCSSALLSHAIINSNQGQQLSGCPSELHLRIAMPPKKAEGFQNGRCNYLLFHEAPILRIAFTPAANT